jgi:hypothetical protein
MMDQMLSSPNFPPQPSVEHLTTIFRRIESGKIVVPAFQRAFVWELGDILDLLESVHAGYPIGSILLWTADEGVLRVSDSQDIPFPRLIPQYPVNYVLDGLQRLSSLYGVFHYNSQIHSNKFSVSFDMVSKMFVPSNEQDLLGTYVPLNALFNPRRLLDIQRGFIEQGLSDRFLSELTELQGRFQEYMVPLVTLTERDVHEVVIIFERVNSTGTKLDRVDFMRAITWSDQFDLNESLDIARESLLGDGFEIPDDTLVKALGLVFDLDPLPEVLLDLRSKSAIELNEAMGRVVHTFRRSFVFLREHLGIFSYDFVPYEGQMLTLFRVFLDRDALSSDQAHAFRAWFFWVSFEEYMQGRPDNFVARTIRAVNAQIEEGYIDFPVTKIDPERFIRRRMLKGKALTTAFLTLLNSQELSTAEGTNLGPAVLTSDYDTSMLLPILSLSEVRSVRGGVQSAKVPANVVLAPTLGFDHLGQDPRITVLQLAETDGGMDVLEGQFIDETAINSLRMDDYSGFLNWRARLISEAASELVGYVD